MRARSIIAAAVGFAALAAAALMGAPAHAQSTTDLRGMSIDELADIDVTSVTKTSETLANAPGAVFVISHEDIVRSGARTIPEILRLAPNLQVSQVAAGRYVITSRGLSGHLPAQAFSNKLLVLIDGRTVYSPLFSGVYWDAQDLIPEDIERIEVISGPGATLWGANAVNGVINITTRGSAQTQGGFVEVTGGNQQHTASLRYGGRMGDDVTWRVYARGLRNSDTRTSTGAAVRDRLDKPQGGFRLDWSAGGENAFTLQGDVYKGTDAQPGLFDERIEGANLVARWTRSGADGSILQVQGFIDHTRRVTEREGEQRLDSYDLDIQFATPPGRRNQLVIGGGVRANRYAINGTADFLFIPPRRTLGTASVFVQDSFAVTGDLKLIVGLKVEADAYSSPEALPSVRLAWKPRDSILLWAAASRAIRSPTPFDRDVVEKAGGSPFVIGGANFVSEKLIAYELGGRFQITPKASLSVSLYYNDYDDLRTIELTPVVFLPLKWGNGMRGQTYGLEAWSDIRVTPWWGLSAGVNLLGRDLEFKPGASGLLGLIQAGNDPRYQAFLNSSMNLGRAVTLDANFRTVGALTHGSVPAYSELNLRLGWNITDDVQVAIVGSNLLHDRHQEFPGPEAMAVPRSVSVGLQWRF